MALLRTFIIAFIFIPGFLFGQIDWYQTELDFGDHVHDPTVFQDFDGCYYLMSTNNNLTLFQSSNLVNWSQKDRLLTRVPSWISSINSDVSDFWAPHLVFMEGKYYAYYSGSSFGSRNSGIGVLVSEQLNPDSSGYGWTDLGEVIHTTTDSSYNAIDPAIVQDQDGKWWMVFGSWQTTGIRMVEIDPSTGKRTSENNKIYHLADRNNSAGIEGPDIRYHDGYYYLFVAWDDCCSTTATYKTKVGRSESITGTYVNKSGTDMRNGASTALLNGYSIYIGPGGGSTFKTSNREYFVHHWYENHTDYYYPRPHFREIIWGDDGWPVLGQPYYGRRQAYEAEHAKVKKVSYAKNSSGASNGIYVKNINQGTSQVRFPIHSFQDGRRIVRVRYGAESEASHWLIVNGDDSVEVAYPAGDLTDFPDTQYVYQEVELAQGYNELIFKPGRGEATLDRIDLLRLAEATIEAGGYDDGLKVSYIEEGANVAIAPGGWLKYEYVFFNEGGFDSLFVRASKTCNGTISFSIDSKGGSPSDTMDIDLVSGQEHSYVLKSAFSELTADHDLYIQNLGNDTLFIDEFGFYGPTFTPDPYILGERNLIANSELKVFPNPATDVLYLNKTVDWELYTLTGTLIKAGYGEEICLQGLNGGLYILRSGQQVIKLLKN